MTDHNSSHRYADDLIAGNTRAGIWGLGYIGFSTMAHLAGEGIRCVGMDVDAAKVRDVNSGVVPVPGLAAWLETDIGRLPAQGLVAAVSNPEEMLVDDVKVHFVAVPTERDGKPWWAALREVMRTLATGVRGRPDYRPLVIIESTLTPGTTDRLIVPLCRELRVELGRDLLVAVAPRRDWFVRREQSLRTLDRVFCGVDPESAEAAEAVLRILCGRLHPASSHYVGELVKCVENAYRHMSITLANQLCLAYPQVDMHEVLRLVGTKWNIDTYHPSFGTGGYCIPLSSQYVLEGAEVPEELTLLSATIGTDMRMRRLVADAVLRRGCRNVAVLGLAYRGDLKVSVMSPAIGITRHLLEAGILARVYDPYYTEVEVAAQTGARALRFPQALEEVDGVIVACDHTAFQGAEVRRPLLRNRNRPVIVDNYGIWADLEWPEGFRYYRAGAAEWLGLEVEPALLS